jgi:hypothetical protein
MLVSETVRFVVPQNLGKTQTSRDSVLFLSQTTEKFPTNSRKLFLNQSVLHFGCSLLCISLFRGFSSIRN